MYTKPVKLYLQNGSKALLPNKIRTLLVGHTQFNQSSSDTTSCHHLQHESECCNKSPHHKIGPEHNFKLGKALIVTKLSRLELEQHRYATLSQPQLEKLIRDRGTDYDSLVYHHHLHKNFQQRVAQSFQRCGVKVQLANRLNLSSAQIQWADILVPIGGDGTFLMAAGRASPLFPDINHTPVVGFNSDPVRSEGRLLLPKQYSQDPNEAVCKIIEGDFKWVHRSRIKITLLGENGDLSTAVDMHETHGTRSVGTELTPQPLNQEEAKKYDAKMKKLLPYLALNEVFIGETMSARVSHLQITKDDDPHPTKTKSSGLCVSTGTGSTSWLTSINRLSESNVQKLLEIIAVNHKVPADCEASAICKEYNDQLIFPADDPRMCYSIREQICIGVWPNPKGFNSRGFCRSLLIKSRCMDASLVIDGSVSYPFNDGAKALLQVHPDDSLLTMSLNSTSTTPTKST